MSETGKRSGGRVRVSGMRRRWRGIALGIGLCAAVGGTVGMGAAMSGARWTQLAYSSQESENPLAALLKGAECEIYDDSQGVPHVRGIAAAAAATASADATATMTGPTAAQELLAYACWGYLHARDRGWQMDFLRRTFQGRRAEVLGKSSLRSDFLMRLLGLEERGLRLFRGMTRKDQERLWAYAWGVNRGFQEVASRKEGVGYEFRELGYLPEPWKPHESVTLVLLQSFDQTRKTYDRDLEERDWLAQYGDVSRELFNPDGVPWSTSIIKRGEQQGTRGLGSVDGKGESHTGTRPASDREALSEARRFLGEGWEGLGAGSNNWVLAPARSRSGKAWLANDPHLSLKHPPFWHYSHVIGGALDVLGVSLPGVPVVVGGANRNMAWGLTNAYLDVADLICVPREDLVKGSRTRPWIWVKLWKVRLPFFFKSFERTEQGWPVIPLPVAEGRALVLRWSGFDLEAKDVAGLSDVMTARSAREMDQALSRVGVPTWNFVFADTAGAIGYRAVGKIPRRENEPELGIRDARLGEIKPWAYLTPEEMPHVLNPARGFVATANNRQWPEGFALSPGRAHTPSFRAFRIEELLVASAKHDLESNRRIQCDVQAVDSRFLLPPLLMNVELARATLSNQEWKAIDLLKTWNHEADLDCRACAIYRFWISELKGELGVDEVGLYRRLQEPGKDQTVTEAAKASLARALQAVPRTPEGEFAPWSQAHRISFQHLGGDARFPELHFFGTPGDDHSVNPGTFAAVGQRPEHVYGASHRLVIELTSPPTIHAILPSTNADVEKGDITREGGPWKRWARCELDRREFPIDWGKVSLSSRRVRL